MPSKQSDYTILTDADGLHVWQELEDGLWYYQIVRNDSIVTKDTGPFESKALALHRALNEYLKGADQ